MKKYSISSEVRKGNGIEKNCISFQLQALTPIQPIHGQLKFPRTKIHSLGIVPTAKIEVYSSRL